MAYFLVTHTSIIEADNEFDAAGKVADELLRGDSLTFEVRGDEQFVKKVIVAGRAREEKQIEPHSSPMVRSEEAPQLPPAKVSEVAQPDAPSSRQPRHSNGVMFCFGAGSAAILYALYHFVV